MKTKIISSAVALSAILSMAALPVSAQIGVDVKAHMEQDRQENRQQNNDSRMYKGGIDKGMDRGDKEVSNRVSSLVKLQARIQGMKNLSDSQKASFSATIQTQITAMNTLLAKIKADISSTTLRDDLKSIAPNYRIYMLIHPQLSILSAVDRIGTVVTTMQSLGTKFDTRLAAHPDASASVKLADMRVKIADASVQAQAAATLVVSLKPDQGVQSVMEANNAALKSARAKLKLASDDIKAAYADARSISATLKASEKASATTTRSRN